MQINSINNQNFSSLNTKKCNMFVNDLKNSDVLKNAAKKYNINVFDTHYNSPKNNEYIYDLVLEIKEKGKGFLNKLFKKGNKGSVTIESCGNINFSKISKTINELTMSDIEKSVSKQENIVKTVDKIATDKIIKDAELDIRYKKVYGEFPQDSMNDNIKRYYHTDNIPTENLSSDDMIEAMKTEIELKYMGALGMI